MNIGDLVKWRGTRQGSYTPLLFGMVLDHLKRGWVSIYWFADNVPINPTREPVMHLELLNGGE